ncbi:MAG: DUF5666 domain-containing protein [Betaproteobacteria bacterium]|jgi:hypothetical protein|nr:DUF5666 domain-containing protein [Betaproteobacteria bacterium]
MPPYGSLNVSKWLGVATVIAAMLAGASYAHGQKQTERYIPLGQSPGLSGKTTALGVVESANSAARAITVAGRTFRVTERTRIWLDRSRIKLTTQDGSFADLQPGRRVEVMPESGTPGAPAAWIKVEMTASGGANR